MKLVLISLCTFLYVNISFSQYEEDVIMKINDQVEIIDDFMESDIFSLDPEEFLDQIADHGAELNGYYEHGRLKKIIRKVGMPNVMVVTIFYFWNDQLILVNYKQRMYMERKNEDGAVVVDYSNSFTQYESKHFYDKGVEINKTSIGAAIDQIELEDDFVDFGLRMKSLLDNKFNNRDIYEALQGKWVNVEFPEEHMIFEETIRFNFRDGKFLKRLKVKIKDDIMYCSSPKDEYVYRYKIESINSFELKLKDLQNSSSLIFVYRKEK